MTELTGFAAKVAREEAHQAELDKLRFRIAQLENDVAKPIEEVVEEAERVAETGGAQAYALDEGGNPVRTGVPSDFAAAHEAAVAASGQLTAEEIAEFRQLRAEQKARNEAAALEAAEAAARLQAPTHHVHLADGSIVEGSSIATHYAHANGRVVRVTGTYELEPAFAV